MASSFEFFFQEEHLGQVSYSFHLRHTEQSYFFPFFFGQRDTMIESFAVYAPSV